MPYRIIDDVVETVPLLRSDTMATDTHRYPVEGKPTSNLSIQDGGHSSTSLDSPKPSKAPWWSIFWDYDPEQTAEERAFVRRLDFAVLTILSLGYFIKNLDQTNISNAFVSGMKEDLNMYGNQINLADTAWTVGYVVGQIPSQIILTKIRPSIWIPSCELVWSLLTFCLAAVKTSDHVIAIRFFVGLVESIFYPAAHFVLGSWYKPSELAKRACIFHASSALASMFSGYLQAAVYKNMNGLHGLAGWKWLFIMDGVISVPIALIGFWIYPDLPENTRAFFFNDRHKEIAKARMKRIGRAERKGLGRSVWKRIFGRWHVYLLVLLYVVFINTGPSSSVNPFALWLKANKYPVSLINIIPTSQSAVQFVATISFAFVSDYYRNRHIPMHVATFFGLFSAVVLAVWNVPPGLKWVAFEIVRVFVPYGPISLSWANEICGGDAEERTIILGLMNASGYAFNAWLPLLTYPQVDQPNFRKGYVFSTCAYIVQFGVTASVWYMARRDRKKKEKEAQGEIEET